MADLELRQEGEVVWATMNRPGRLNALSRGLVNELREFFTGLYWRRDVRIVTPTARMNAAFIRIGLSACDIGVSYFLPRMVGASVAAEYMLTGRFIDAERAYQLGLVSRVVPADRLQAEAQGFVDDMLHATPLG